MNAQINPYQWELLAAMIAYKLSNGLCIDYQRLNSDDRAAMHEAEPLLSEDSIRKWFDGRPPAKTALDALCHYTCDIFPYGTWESFSSSETDDYLFFLCQDWGTYNKLKASKPESKNGEKFKTIKNWALSRLMALAPKSDLSPNIILIHRQNPTTEFAGEYLCFMPGQIPPKQFAPVYVNPVWIDDEGQVTLQNGYTKKYFKGSSTIKDANTLQIILYNSEDRSGFEYVFSIRINKYGKTANHFPGIGLGFDGDSMISSYPILLTADLGLKYDSGFVKHFFEKCYDEHKLASDTGRLNCQTPSLLLKLSAQS